MRVMGMATVGVGAHHHTTELITSTLETMG